MEIIAITNRSLIYLLNCVRVCSHIRPIHDVPQTETKHFSYKYYAFLRLSPG